jgi:hypothetical protein
MWRGYFSAVALGVPIARGHGLKFACIRGRARERIGADTDTFVAGRTKPF